MSVAFLEDEKKSGKTPHILRLRWDGDALFIKYQPRLFHYFYVEGYRWLLSIFFLGEYAVRYPHNSRE